MIDEPEIWACANELIRQHGDVAWFFAALRADDLREAGDMEGNRIFMRILARIRELESMVPTSTLH